MALASVTVLTALLVWTTKALANAGWTPSPALQRYRTGLIAGHTYRGYYPVVGAGYDVIGGARFYGIGNEYGGVLFTLF